jgi:heme exporter protein B
LRYFWQTFKAIFVKDIVIELRLKQTLPTMIVLGILIVWILRIACMAETTSVAVIASAAVWIAFLFSGLLAQQRSFTAEQQQDCIYGLLLAPVDPGTIFLAKMLVNVVMLSIFEIIIVPVVFLLFKVDAQDKYLDLFVVLLLGNFAISSVGTLFSAIVGLSHSKSSLLSIIVFAVLSPMMIPAMFALLIVFGAIPDGIAGTSALAFIGGYDTAIGYLLVFDAVFVVACWLLFGLAIKE